MNSRNHNILYNNRGNKINHLDNRYKERKVSYPDIIDSGFGGSLFYIDRKGQEEYPLMEQN